MTLFLFLIIVAWLLLLMGSQFLPKAGRRRRGRTSWPEQDSTTITPTPDTTLLYDSTQGTPSSYADSVTYVDTSSGTPSADAGVWDAGYDANAGSIDYGSGGDFGGGGAGGSWSDNSS